MISTRRELEGVQTALTQQTQRCRQLVSEFSKKLQSKEIQLRSERKLRDEQLAKVLRALLLFEARLVKEQKHIRHQLLEKDSIINYQQIQIKKLHLVSPSSSTHDSLDSNSEVYSSDNWLSKVPRSDGLDSSSDIYASISENDYKQGSVSSQENISRNSFGFVKNRQSYTKNDMKRMKRGRKFFEAAKRDDSSSNEDDKSKGILETSERIENIFAKNQEIISYSQHMNSLHGIKPRVSTPTVTDELYTNSSISGGSSITTSTNYCSTGDIRGSYEPNGNFNCFSSTKSESEITAGDDYDYKLQRNDSIEKKVFEFDKEGNENWYASASDQEDDPQCDIYKNNPVLECMNQILLQNINDTIHSPPKSPVPVKAKTSKRVKFIDENNQEVQKEEVESNYYETPIQNVANVYEVPQSMYSNDYEQILIEGGNWGKESPKEKPKQKNENLEDYYYVDMEQDKLSVSNKYKISRTPPALPPKPANLVSKYKINGKPLTVENLSIINKQATNPEPDYCSISELNHQETPQSSLYDQIISNAPNIVSTAQQTPVKIPTTPKSKPDSEIPKLPQVSEIIIPSESDTESKDEKVNISQDNYIKNSSQIFKKSPKKTIQYKTPIVVGRSVSSLITGFNNHHIVAELTKTKRDMFANFENQNSVKQIEQSEIPPNFEKFDLSQNFEEFNLDDCEITEEYHIDIASDNEEKRDPEKVEEDVVPVDPLPTPVPNPTVITFESQQPNYEQFLECTGLSSKSILTPSRLLSNHKSMLKPKDVKLRNKVRSYATVEKQTSTIKYYSEPYL